MQMLNILSLRCVPVCFLFPHAAHEIRHGSIILVSSQENPNILVKTWYYSFSSFPDAGYQVPAE